MSDRASQGSGVLIFVEDPGAVNCIAPLVDAMTARGAPRFVLLSSGLGTALLQARGLAPTHVASPTDAVEALWRERCAWVLVGTSENAHSPAFALIAAARACGATSAAVIDFGANAAHRFRGTTQDALAHAPDYVLVPDSWTAREFHALGLAAARVHVVGHAHHDYLAQIKAQLDATARHEVRERVLPAAARDRSVLVFTSEISGGLDAAQYRKSAEYTLHGRGRSALRTEIVVEELLDAVAALPQEVDRPYLVLRQHPKETSVDLAAHRAEFDAVSAGGNVLELLFAADLVVGMSSMALTEAHVLGTPVISLLPRAAERDWLPIVRSSSIACATQRQAFRGLLRDALLAGRQVPAGETRSIEQTSSMSCVERMLAFIGAPADPAARSARA